MNKNVHARNIAGPSIHVIAMIFPSQTAEKNPRVLSRLLTSPLVVVVHMLPGPGAPPPQREPIPLQHIRDRHEQHGQTGQQGAGPVVAEVAEQLGAEQGEAGAGEIAYEPDAGERAGGEDHVAVFDVEVGHHDEGVEGPAEQGGGEDGRDPVDVVGGHGGPGEPPQGDGEGDGGEFAELDAGFGDVFEGVVGFVGVVVGGGFGSGGGVGEC